MIVTVETMPEYLMDCIAKCVLKEVTDFVSRPGGKELLDAKIEETKGAKE